MPVITFTTLINAPAARCFDLARSIDFHAHSMSATRERPIAGTTTGLIGPGQQVTWQARHLGRLRTLTSRICAFDPPRMFADEMVTGDFKSFRHEHTFTALSPSTTQLDDRFEFTSPFGPLGHLANALFLTAYMRRLLQGHAQRLRAALESDEWRAFLPHD